MIYIYQYISLEWTKYTTFISSPRFLTLRQTTIEHNTGLQESLNEKPNMKNTNPVLSVLGGMTSLNRLSALSPLYFSNLLQDDQHVFPPVFSSPLRVNEANNGESDGGETKTKTTASPTKTNQISAVGDKPTLNP